jgi:hypothetical protein
MQSFKSLSCAFNFSFILQYLFSWDIKKEAQNTLVKG